MKKGLEIRIQKDISKEDKVKIKKWLNIHFLSNVLSNDCQWNHLTRGGHGGWGLKRGTLGYMFDKMYREEFPGGYEDGKYTFRRISRNKRIFGVVKLEDLEFIDEPYDQKKNACICSQCNGDKRVKMNLDNNEDFETYCTIGETEG